MYACTSIRSIARLATCALLLGALSACSTSILRQTSNQFNSNTYVAWVPPIRGASVHTLGEKGNDFLALTPTSASPEGLDSVVAVRTGDCFAVDYAGGFLHHSFEGAVETAYSRLFGRIRSELTVAVKVEHRSPLSVGDKKTDGVLTFNNNGQLALRPITGQSYEMIYGPATYRDGDLQLIVAVSEQDGDEYRQMVEDSVRFLKGVQKLSPNQAGFPEVLKQIREQSTLADVSKLTIAPFGYVAIGAQAVVQGAKILEAVHGDADTVIKESITLTTAAETSERLSPARPRLRYGTYLFMRSSVDDGAVAPCVRFARDSGRAQANFKNRQSCSLEPKDPDPWRSVTWIGINVRPLLAAMCVSAPGATATGSPVARNDMP